MTERLQTTEALLDLAWERLELGLTDMSVAARLPTLATLGPDGWPEARTVVLRATNPAAPSIAVHTDRYSGKMASLRALPRAAFHIWDAPSNLQIRLQAAISIAEGAEVAAAWAKVPDHSRQSYGVVPPPGTPIADPLAYAKTPDPDSFCILTAQITRIDLVHLGLPHRRAVYLAETGWRGQWLAP